MSTFSRIMGQGAGWLEQSLPSRLGGRVVSSAVARSHDRNHTFVRLERMAPPVAEAAGAVFAQRSRTFCVPRGLLSSSQRSQPRRFEPVPTVDSAAQDREAARARREVVGTLLWQTTSLARDGDILPPANDALRWRLLDGAAPAPAARDRIVNAPLPRSYGEIFVPDLPIAARDDVATYGFEAWANAVGTQAAQLAVLPLLSRFGFGPMQAQEFARTAAEDYAAHRGMVSHHHLVLQLAVVGIGQLLCQPRDRAAEAADRIGTFNPDEDAMTANLARALRRVQCGARYAELIEGGPVEPAMSIAALVAAYFYRDATRSEVDAAFRDFGQQAGFAEETVLTWLARNR